VISGKVAGVSDLGVKYKENQDYMALGQHGDNLVLIVCDGVSQSQNSMAGSKAASETARDHIMAAVKAGTITDVNVANQTVKDAAVKAQEAICTIPFIPPKSEDDYPPAQATFVGCLVMGKRITIGWVGDSRAYWIAGRQTATQVSIDDSWVNYAVNELKMTLEDALKDKRAHAIVESLGAANDGSNPGVEPDARSLNISEDGILLVVSDGFWNYADNPPKYEIKTITDLINQLPKDADALTIARHLVQYARKAGGHDNITVVAAIFSSTAR